jgi:hypothetical protein
MHLLSTLFSNMSRPVSITTSFATEDCVYPDRRFGETQNTTAAGGVSTEKKLTVVPDRPEPMCHWANCRAAPGKTSRIWTKQTRNRPIEKTPPRVNGAGEL